MIRPTPTTERLGRLPLFEGCDPRELEAVAKRTTTVHARRGEVLLQKGTVGREMLVIAEGTAVVMNGHDVVATLGPGDVAGELAVLDGGRRSATVVADTDMVIEVSTSQELTELLTEVPTLGTRLFTQVAARLRTAMAS
jgi:CRP-like cAMP-binding protein